MDNLAYLANRHFILVAVDTRFEAQNRNEYIEIPFAKKVYKLNEHCLISAIGNPFKITDIYQYIFKLNELGDNGDFKQVLENIKDVFGLSHEEIQDGIQKISKLIPKFQNKEGILLIEDLIEHLEDKPHLQAILKDSLFALNNSFPVLAQVLLFGWDKKLKKCQLSHLLSLGEHLTESTPLKMQDEFIYIKLISNAFKPIETLQLENKLIEELTPFLIDQWDTHPDQLNVVLEKGKMVLSKALYTINPYESKPEIVFYELSQRTDFGFIEPQKELESIEFRRVNQ